MNFTEELEIERWFLPAADANEYNETAKKLGENLLNIWARERFGKIRPVKGNLLGISMKSGNRIRSVWMIGWMFWIFMMIMGSLMHR